MALAKERQEKEIEHRAKMDEVQKRKMEIAREEERAKEEFRRIKGSRGELSYQTRIG